jgi:hypothetical protein
MGSKTWKWYAVKLIYESIVFGEPNQEKLDENYEDKLKCYEETIILIKAQSFDHAYKLAEEKAKKKEGTYENIYDQTVKCRFVEAIDCFWLFDDELKNGDELYSRFINVPIETDTEEFLDKYYPETIPPKDEKINYNFKYLYKNL